jgi:hypothetical protein
MLPSICILVEATLACAFAEPGSIGSGIAAVLGSLLDLGNHVLKDALDLTPDTKPANDGQQHFARKRGHLGMRLDGGQGFLDERADCRYELAKALLVFVLVGLDGESVSMSTRNDLMRSSRMRAIT